MDTFPYSSKSIVLFGMSRGINKINSFHLKKKKRKDKSEMINEQYRRG